MSSEHPGGSGGNCSRYWTSVNKKSTSPWLREQGNVTQRTPLATVLLRVVPDERCFRQFEFPCAVTFVETQTTFCFTRFLGKRLRVSSVSPGNDGWLT